MNDFITWINAPSAYNWLTLIGVFGGLMTALFTGYSASAQWRDRRKHVRIEWVLEYEALSPRVILYIYNGTEYTLSECLLKIGSPLTKVLPMLRGNTLDKHESWKDNEAFLRVIMGQSTTTPVTFAFYPDPSELRRLASSRSSKFWHSVAILFWRRLGWRIPVGVKFPMSITLRRRSSQILPIRKTHTIRINADMALKIAEDAEAKAVKK